MSILENLLLLLLHLPYICILVFQINIFFNSISIQFQSWNGVLNNRRLRGHMPKCPIVWMTYATVCRNYTRRVPSRQCLSAKNNIGDRVHMRAGIVSAPKVDKYLSVGPWRRDGRPHDRQLNIPARRGMIERWSLPSASAVRQTDDADKIIYITFTFTFASTVYNTQRLSGVVPIPGIGVKTVSVQKCLSYPLTKSQRQYVMIIVPPHPRREH